MTNLSQSYRGAAVIRQNNLCFYCGWPMWNGADESLAEFCGTFDVTVRQARMLRCTAEHLTAAQDGGRSTRLNIVAACEICNRRRHPRYAKLSWENYKSLVRKRVAAQRWHPASFYKVIGKVRPTNGAMPVSFRHAIAYPPV